MPAPQTITVQLSQEETDFIWDYAQSEYPNLSGATIIRILERQAKLGIRNFIWAELWERREERDRAEEDNFRGIFIDDESATPDS